MIRTLREIINGALQRLSLQIMNDLPPLLAALIIMLAAYLAAILCRWLVTRAVKGIEADRWIRQSGIGEVLHMPGVRTSRLAAQVTYWAILIAGVLAAINVFGSQFTSRLVESAVLLFPRLLAAGAIVLAGLWVAQYLGRSVLVWAVNEDLPAPRRLAVAVRTLAVLSSVVVAAETVNFAPRFFLASFLILLGGAVLAASLAIGLGARDAVRNYLGRFRAAHDETRAEAISERSFWNHL
jgi:hypothetical protein